MLNFQYHDYLGKPHLLVWETPGYFFLYGVHKLGKLVTFAFLHNGLIRLHMVFFAVSVVYYLAAMATVRKMGNPGLYSVTGSVFDRGIWEQITK